MSFVSRAKETSEDSSGRPPKTLPIKDYDPSEFKLVNIGIQNPTLDMAALNAAQEAAHKVWQKHDFFPVSFLLKMIDLPGGHINEPLSGKYFLLPFFHSYQQPPVSVSDP